MFLRAQIFLLFLLVLVVPMVKLYYILFILSLACSSATSSSSSSSSDEDVPRVYSPAWWGGFDSTCLSALEREVGMYLTVNPRIFCGWCTASFFQVPPDDETAHGETIVQTSIRVVEEMLYPQGLENVLETSLVFPHADGRLKLSEIFVLKRALVAIAIYNRVGLLRTVGTKKGAVPIESLVNEKMEETFSVLTFQMIIVRTRGWNYLRTIAGKMHLSRFSQILGRIGFRSNLDWFNSFFIQQNDIIDA